MVMQLTPFDIRLSWKHNTKLGINTGNKIRCRNEVFDCFSVVSFTHEQALVLSNAQWGLAVQVTTPTQENRSVYHQIKMAQLEMGFPFSKAMLTGP